MMVLVGIVETFPFDEQQIRWMKQCCSALVGV